METGAIGSYTVANVRPARKGGPLMLRLLSRLINPLLKKGGKTVFLIVHRRA
ncbi:MAG: hypothetical protein ACM3X6_04130 [Patescibacteria group bacterium]